MSLLDPYASLRFKNFRYLIVARFFATVALQMIGTVLGWHLYELTGSKFILGFVGLLEVLPVLLLSLYAGQLADKVDRRRMALTAQFGFCAAALLLVFCTVIHAPVHIFYLAIFGVGLSRAFNFPASSTLLVRTVPKDLYSNAAAWSSNAWQFAAVLGPALGGILISATHSPLLAYGAGAACLLGGAYCLSRMELDPQEPQTSATTGILKGLHFLLENRLLLSIISLDLFAVLLGGAVALLPVYARDILQIGPTGLGYLRAAPSIGALITSFWIAHRRPFLRPGVALLLAISGFGIATIVFGLSTLPQVSFIALMIIGGFDSVSVIIRSTLLLVQVPDNMRGRVSAINAIFVGSSNELGAFESGLVAHAFGAVASVVAGGVGTLLVVLITALKVPELRTLREPRKNGAPLLENADLTGEEAAS